MPSAALVGPLVLGWRWVPGLERVYQCSTRLVLSSGRVGRSEVWTYLVREVDRQGTALLEARRVGRGGGVEGPPLPPLEPPPPPRPDRLRLRMSMDGRLEGLHPDSFGGGWPHQALALRLPEHPVDVWDAWPDAELVRPFAALLPLSEALELHGESRLRGLDLHEGSHWALLSSEGRVRSATGLEVEVQGTATWDADRGALVHRSLVAQTRPSPREGGPGRLEIQVDLQV